MSKDTQAKDSKKLESKKCEKELRKLQAELCKLQELPRAQLESHSVQESPPHSGPRSAGEIRSMNLTTASLLIKNTKTRPLFLCALAVLLCSCAATSIKNTWKPPDCHGPVGKLAVLAIEERGLLRQGFENRFVEQLTKCSAGAVPTYDLFSLAQIKQDKRASADRLGASGAKALILLRLLDKTSTYREIQPGGERYVGVITGWETMGWYDYYNVGLMSMSSTYGSLKENVYLETSVYDLKTEKRLWSVLTRTVVTENMDRIAEMDPLIEKIVAAMKKDGLIP